MPGGMKQGQQGTTAVPSGQLALTLTSGEESEQRRSPGHAVYGMQALTAESESLAG
jgi:hypothetical protein